MFLFGAYFLPSFDEVSSTFQESVHKKKGKKEEHNQIITTFSTLVAFIGMIEKRNITTVLLTSHFN